MRSMHGVCWSNVAWKDSGYEKVKLGLAADREGPVCVPFECRHQGAFHRL